MVAFMEKFLVLLLSNPTILLAFSSRDFCSFTVSKYENSKFSKAADLHYQINHANHPKKPFTSFSEMSPSSNNELSRNRKSDLVSHFNEGIRLNKVLKETHSRREADALIESGRITVNGKAVGSKGGFKVIPFVDSVELDGQVVSGWEQMNGYYKTSSSTTPSSTKALNKKRQYVNNHFEYIKYWKPRGVTCTTERTVRTNIIDEIQRDGYRLKHRIFPVGRLDKDTSGLIILTSDGRLPNSVLRGEAKQPKVYEVTVNRPIQMLDVENLRKGVVITTVAMRDRKKATPLTARTLPCTVEQISSKKLRMTLIEGRNRQVRKMLGALNYDVVRLHRVRFMGMGLDPLRGPGDWKKMNRDEMKLVENALRVADGKK